MEKVYNATQLNTAELDQLETILCEWLFSHQGKESSENRFLCRRLLALIKEKDEAFLFV